MKKVFLLFFFMKKNLTIIFISNTLLKNGGKMKKKTSAEKELTGCLIRIRSAYADLYSAEKKVADFILANSHEIMHLSVTEIAAKSGASEATVVRFCRSLGYGGYQDFKLTLARDTVSPIKSIHEDLEKSDDISTITHKVFQNNIQALTDTLAVLDMKEMEKAVDAISKAGKVLIIGVGTSAPNVQDAYNKFFRIGLNCSCQTDSHLQVMEAALLNKGDVLIAISHSGSTKDPIETLLAAKKRGAVTICITNNSLSPITKEAHISLLTASRETRFKSEALASRIAQTSIINALLMALSLQRFNKTLKFAKQIEEAIVIKQY